MVDIERGGHRNGRHIAAALHQQRDIIRSIARQARRSPTCLARIDRAERGVPTLPATSEFVAGYVHQQVRQLDLSQPVSYALHAHLSPACDLARVAQSRTGRAGAPLRALAARRRVLRVEPGGVGAGLRAVQQRQRQQQAKELAEGFQRASSNVAGCNGYLSLRQPPLRGGDRPRKRECLTAIHHFFRTREDGTTAAERFLRQKPRSMVAAILPAIDLSPAPLSPPRRAAGSHGGRPSGQYRDQGRRVYRGIIVG